MRKKDSRGCKPREVLNGILWVLRTGAPWKDLPERHPPHQTCHRRFQCWVKAGVFRRIIEELAADLQERGGIDLREAFIDGSFVPARKGAVRPDKARQREPDHGNCGRFRSSCLRLPCRCFAS